MSKYDVIIVGARVAGATIATLLGEQGYRVLVLDRARFPSDTLSTHFFRSPTFKVLQRLGVFDKVLRQAPRLVNNYNDVDGHVFTEPVTDTDGPSYYLCVRRITMDAILFRRMQQVDAVTIRQGCIVTDLLSDNGKISGVRWKEGGSGAEAYARLVVGADGVRSTVASSVKPELEHFEPVRRAMYYGYFEALATTHGPAAEFHYRGNRLVYVFPTDGNLTLIASSIPIEEFETYKKNLPKSFFSEVESMSTLQPRFAHATRVGPLLGSARIPGYRKVPYGDGWALAGDSEQVMDPWSGQGIDQASTHASLLADALIAWLSGTSPWETAMADYHRRRNEFSIKTYERTCSFARDLRLLTIPALKKRGLV
ncbi:MAG: FAD-dependent monooxygenase [Ignavibacteriales bacterium]|nr:FAD-dependent monooxygenase [Ignavibacteriales bacterium]